MSKIEKKPLVAAIVGPTATGKTDAAVSLCLALGGEAISMDSMQIYQRLTIGTAKPTPEEMRGVPHHLLSFVPPDTPYTVQEYQRDARAKMTDVLARGNLPVFVGGTGLYLQAVSRPLNFAQAGETSTVRECLQHEAETSGGPEALHCRLASVDPETAARLHVNDIRRVIRALEVYETTGTPMSAGRTEWDADSAEDWAIFALSWPREVLYTRINQRVDIMLQRGLLNEVESLLRSGLSPETQAMRAIGYQEFVAYFQGHCTLEDAVGRVKMNSRRYAKRQMTWFRRDARVQWISLDQYNEPEAVHQAIIGRVRTLQEERQ